MRLMGKVAIITGAGRGIGQATASSSRAKVPKSSSAISHRNGSKKRSRCARRRAAMHSASWPTCATSRASRTWSSVTVQQWGRVDCLVNNAGIVMDAQLKNMTEDQFDNVIEINLKGVYNCTKAVVDVDARAAVGRHPQRVVDRGPVRQFRPDELCRQQIRRDRHGEDVGARARPQGHTRQRSLSRLHRTTIIRFRSRTGARMRSKKKSRWAAWASRRKSPTRSLSSLPTRRATSTAR